MTADGRDWKTQGADLVVGTARDDRPDLKLAIRPLGGVSVDERRQFAGKLADLLNGYETPLTANQRTVLAAVTDWAHPYPPSLRDLAEVTGLAVSTVRVIVGQLVTRGRLTWPERGTARLARAIRLTEGAPS